MKPNRKITELNAAEEKYCTINSMKLIHLVRAQEILYNSEAEGYSDKNLKDMAWERVYRSLFPRYETLSPNTKDLIATNVRRRWKTLRDAVAREIKKNASVENFIRKKESPVFSELEFLIPHIRSAHCAKLADALGLRDSYNNVHETDEQEYDEDYNDTVDLTEEQQDIKFDLKREPKSKDLDSSGITAQTTVFYPTVQLHTLDGTFTNSKPKNLASAWRQLDNVVAAAATNQTPQSTSNNENWRGEYCSIVQCKEGEFMNSTLLCTNPENEENHDDSMPVTNQQQQPQQQQRQTKLLSPNLNTRKRPRHYSGNDSQNDDDVPMMNGDASSNVTEATNEIQNKILRCLTSLDRREYREQDTQDEDRMFLLSLVSDLKRVPPAKKMLLKAEIAMAIARAIPS